jgi:cation diffusion facilitator CzcD-associated flavoprotein CzcO
MTVDWLVIGGGIHGVHIAARLIGDAEVSRDRVRIVDPGEQLLERWRTCTTMTGMTHLRSPAVHHLDLDPWSLLRQAGKRKKRKKQKKQASDLFAPPYDRPNLGFFNDHCDKVIDTFGLSDLHIRARVTACTVNCDGVKVELSTGQEVEASNVVLAIGTSDQPQRPEWAPAEEARVQHAFDTDFDGWPSSQEVVAVVGGGISAGQLALRLADEGHQVHLISRHPLREHQFDSEPGWLGPKFMTNFNRDRNLQRRRALITEARHKGSVPPDVRRALHVAIENEKLKWHEDEVKKLTLREKDLAMHLKSGDTIVTNRIILGTGFGSDRPGGKFVDQLVESAELPCADCGYPIVDRALRWHPRVYVTGPLAELEIGPASRNIAGARRAGDRLVRAARSVRSSTPLRA